MYSVLTLSFLLWPLQPAKAGEVWEMVGGYGLGDPNNTFIPTLETWNNVIYAGVGNYVVGGRIYRSTDGNTWTKVNTDGFGHVGLSTIFDFQSFGGQLYATTIDDRQVPAQPAEIWHSLDGVTWTQSGGAGLGHAHNTGFYQMAEFNGQLYTGSRNDTDGAEIYRTADGTNWNLVPATAGGFADINNKFIWGMYSSGDWLWAGTGNNNGAQVWRSLDGTNWNLFMDYAGDPIIGTTTIINNFFVLNGELCWSGIDATVGANIAQRHDDIFMTIYVGGLGNVKNIWFSQNTVVSGGLMYFGTRNDTTGGELWYTSDFQNITQIGQDGFGNVDNYAAYALTFKDYLYVGFSTTNGAKGLEIWRRYFTSNFAITTKSLENGQQGSAYSSRLAASGGTQPLTWKIASGNLPKGLSLNSTTGEISGTPQESGEFIFTIEVQDSGKKSQKARHIYTLKIVAGATDSILNNIRELPKTGSD